MYSSKLNFGCLKHLQPQPIILLKLSKALSFCVSISSMNIKSISVLRLLSQTIVFGDNVIVLKRKCIRNYYNFEQSSWMGQKNLYKT